MGKEDVARPQAVLLVELRADTVRPGSLTARLDALDDTALNLASPVIIELKFWREGQVLRGSVRRTDGSGTGYFQGNDELLDFIASMGVRLASDA